MLEASIIFHLEYTSVSIGNNLNYEGYPAPRHVCEDEANFDHHVYIALKPLPPETVAAMEPWKCEPCIDLEKAVFVENCIFPRTKGSPKSRFIRHRRVKIADLRLLHDGLDFVDLFYHHELMLMKHI